SRMESEMDAEMRFHVEAYADDLERAGMDRAEALRRAQVEFGGVEQAKEECREARGVTLMENFAQDVKFGGRMLRKDPGFTAVAVLTLALGIGATTAIFSVVENVLLRALPYPAAGQLVASFDSTPGQPQFPTSVADFYDYRQRTNIFSSSALYAQRDLDLTTGDRPEHLSGMGVTHDYFSVLGYHPALGRDFEAKEEYANNNHVAILSDRLWRTRFNSDGEIVGKTVHFSSEPFTVIGVMPPGVQHVGGTYRSSAQGDTVDLWWPLPLEPHQQNGCDRQCHYLNMIARLRPGITLEQASAQINTTEDQINREFRGNDFSEHVLLVPLKEQVVGRARLILTVVMAAVGFLLLIACVNVANLSLARATARQREIGVRSALGANRTRIVRQMLTESLLLAAIGTVLGLPLAKAGIAALVALSPEQLPRVQAVQLDWVVLIFATITTVVTALIFGLAPALATARRDVDATIRERGSRGSTSGARHRALRDWLVVSEIALALVLLAGAGLLMRTFSNLQHVEMGFQPAHVLVFHTDLPEKRYPKDEQFIQFYKDLYARLKALPGVQFVAETTDVPWDGYDENASFEIVGASAERNNDAGAQYHFVSPEYFSATGIPLISGRFFEETDTEKTQAVTIVNASFARRYFPGENAIGKKLNFFNRKNIEIVGVVGDVKPSPNAPAAEPSFYWPDWQTTQRLERMVVVRSNASLAALASAIPGEVRAVDKELPVTHIEPLGEVAAHAVSTARFTVILVGFFAGLAVMLAAVGIFGVMAYSVTQRTNEIGIRAALGALPSDLRRMVVAQASKLTVFGVVAGAAAALLLSRSIQTLLFQVSSNDPSTYFGVAAFLTGIALMASYIAARRATRVEPVAALRYE
ncbi:MAG TPA: ABC transporter permease, partial [Candidatus Acidoferrum sp.]|nr:ABC transporter permease [Candidatus Acidoferrum sp.]